MARGAPARFGLDEICGVTLNEEAHVASMETYDVVWSRGCVVHEHLCLLDGVSGGRSLLGANLIECDKHCGVDGARGIEESASDDLHACDAAFIKFWCSCGVGEVLHRGPIHMRGPFVGRVLGARGHGVLELIQYFADRVGHGDFNVFSRVVPFDVKPAVPAARSVNSDGVILLERVEEVLVPKSSIVRVKVVGRVAWVKRPGG